MHDFLNKINVNLTKPNKKFLRDGIIGLIRSGNPIVCQMARRLPNNRPKYTTRLKRLDAHLVADNDFDDRIKQALPDIWLGLIDDDTPIILDLSDISKPFAKKMDYLARGFPKPEFYHWPWGFPHVERGEVERCRTAGNGMCVPPLDMRLPSAWTRKPFAITVMISRKSFIESAME